MAPTGERRTLVLLRHAKSSWDDPDLDDHERPLAERGRRDATQVGTLMAERRIRPDLVLCSTAERTRQTWKRAERAGARAVEVRFDDRVYEASSYGLLRLVQSVPDEVRSLLVLGHGPGLPDLADRLSIESTSEAARRMRMKFPTSGLALFAVTVPWAQLREASLLDFVVPRG
ncbi:SixA phosphatase family protein [Microlunatus ginsengisoli]|uniref:Histidine phosphatase family protein n=1 Tax=Microlunatus ginsengisoli TaxID=363863 RepID=A0ABP6ZEZ6_9ACTN